MYCSFSVRGPSTFEISSRHFDRDYIYELLAVTMSVSFNRFMDCVMMAFIR